MESYLKIIKTIIRKQYSSLKIRNFIKDIKVRISAYLKATDAILISFDEMLLSAPEIVNDIESIYRETYGFSQDHISCFQISTDADLDFLNESPCF